MTAPAWRLRPARFSDGDALYAIEQRAHSHPWTRSQMDEILDGDGAVLVAEDADGRCLGYAVLALAVDDSDLLNIAVEPQYRRRGLGRFLLDGILAEARRRGCRRCFLEVRVSNQAALALYRQRGFAEVGRRRDYYPAAGGREDARVLCLEFTAEGPS